MERIVALLQQRDLAPPDPIPDAYLVAVGARAQSDAHRLAEAVRDEAPDARIVVDAGAGSFRSKMKRADRSGARIALVFGDREVEAGMVGVKYLREPREQSTVEISTLGPFLRGRATVRPDRAAALDEV